MANGVLVMRLPGKVGLSVRGIEQGAQMARQGKQLYLNRSHAPPLSRISHPILRTTRTPKPLFGLSPHHSLLGRIKSQQCAKAKSTPACLPPTGPYHQSRATTAIRKLQRVFMSQDPMQGNSTTELSSGTCTPTYR